MARNVMVGSNVDDIVRHTCRPWPEMACHSLVSALIFQDRRAFSSFGVPRTLTERAILVSLGAIMLDVATIDLILRGAAMGTLVLCAALFAVRGRGGRKHLAVSLLCLSLCAYVIVSAPGLHLPSAVLQHVLLGVAGVIPVLVYWAAMELFHDDFDIRHWQISLSLAVVLLAWATQGPLELGMIRGVCVLILFGHMLLTVLSGHTDDLIEERRHFRSAFLIWMIGIGSVITGFEITHLDRALPDWVFALQAGVIWLTVLSFVIWAVSLPGDLWITRSPGHARKKEENPARGILIRRIEAAMAEGMWRQEGLTISGMAQALDTPEHRLRGAINQGLGHRNFASFVNEFRIREARALLESTEHVDQTVLSIAYEVGFASLGPFNRAFRQQTGMAPTEYRKSQLSRQLSGSDG